MIGVEMRPPPGREPGTLSGGRVPPGGSGAAPGLQGGPRGVSGSGLDSPFPAEPGLWLGLVCAWKRGPDLPGAFQLGDSDTTHDSEIPELARRAC